MPNPFKYSTSTPSNALRKGNVAVGVNNVEYGPTSTTGWYSGIDIPEGGYVVYTIGLNNNTLPLIIFCFILFFIIPLIPCFFIKLNNNKIPV